MFGDYGRKALVGALLATALSAPAFADDYLNTSAQTLAGHVAIGVAFLQTSPTVVGEGYVTESNDRVAVPGSRPTARPEALTSGPTVRQPGVVQRIPLILGIGY
jgi:hypothetical protein